MYLQCANYVKLLVIYGLGVIIRARKLQKTSKKNFKKNPQN